MDRAFRETAIGRALCAQEGAAMTENKGTPGEWRVYDAPNQHHGKLPGVAVITDWNGYKREVAFCAEVSDAHLIVRAVNAYRTERVEMIEAAKRLTAALNSADRLEQFNACRAMEMLIARLEEGGK